MNQLKNIQPSKFLGPIVLVIIIVLTVLSMSVVFYGVNTFKTMEWVMIFLFIFLIIVNLVGVVLLNQIYERLGNNRR